MKFTSNILIGQNRVTWWEVTSLRIPYELSEQLCWHESTAILNPEGLIRHAAAITCLNFDATPPFWPLPPSPSCHLMTLTLHIRKAAQSAKILKGERANGLAIIPSLPRPKNTYTLLFDCMICTCVSWALFCMQRIPDKMWGAESTRTSEACFLCPLFQKAPRSSLRCSSSWPR